jgi:Ca-activated chloride channel family protein
MLRFLIIAGVMVVPLGAANGVTLRDDMHSNISRGNTYYQAGEHNKALQRYQEAQGLDSTFAVPHFNAGDALYRLGDYRNGALEFLKSTASETDSIKAMSYYNLGNTMFQAGDIQSAVEAYKRSLLIDPEDQDAKYNLELALRMMEQQEQQQQQDQQQQEQQGQEDQEQQQDRQEKEDQQQEDQDQQQDQTQEPRPGEQQKPPEISPEELERILAAIEASDKKTQEEMMQKVSRRKTSTGKDW